MAFASRRQQQASITRHACHISLKPWSEVLSDSRNIFARGYKLVRESHEIIIIIIIIIYINIVQCCITVQLHQQSKSLPLTGSDRKEDPAIYFTGNYC